MTRRLERAIDNAEEAEHVLRAIEGSRAFALAEQISKVRGRGNPAVSRESVRRALGD
jgi:hypothetical protein